MAAKNKPLAAAIRSIHIKNFRAIDDLSLSFIGPDGSPCQVNVIAGPNGSGKTSVLESCLIAARQLELVTQNSSIKAKELQAQGYEISAVVQPQGGGTVEVHRTGSRSQKQSSHETGSKENWRIPCAYFSSWRAQKLIGPVAVTAGKKGKRPGPVEENRLWIIKQYLVNAKAYELMSEKGLFQLPSQYDVLINRLNDTWKLFHPHLDCRFSVEPTSEDLSEGFDVFLWNGDLRISVDQLSSGELELFDFAAWMIAEKFEGGIIFIDEPELHLDPQWHKLLLEALKRLQPDSQFIVATHSPEIFDGVASYERHLLIPKSDPRFKFWSRTAG